MDEPAADSERREYTRQGAYAAGWVRTPDRPPLPCVVHNMSPKGALVDLDIPHWLPIQFELELEAPGLTFLCEMRHTGQGTIGVVFLAEIPRPVQNVN